MNPVGVWLYRLCSAHCGLLENPFAMYLFRNQLFCDGRIFSAFEQCLILGKRRIAVVADTVKEIWYVNVQLRNVRWPVLGEWQHVALEVLASFQPTPADFL